MLEKFVEFCKLMRIYRDDESAISLYTEVVDDKNGNCGLSTWLSRAIAA
ncbi:hypothetical protein [Pseudomonas sp.]|nr:hypothetical protein [Pseudomonas sp.]